MKVYVPNNSKQGIGGGWTFLRNIQSADNTSMVFVSTWQECDVILITGATITDKDEMRNAKQAGKKIVLRVDNIPRDSRNRGTAFSRMLLFATLADAIIYQSEWAKMYVGWWFHKRIDMKGKSEQVVYNGVNKDFFYPSEEPKESDTYLFVQYNRDENKRYTEAFYDFHMRYREQEDSKLILAGRYADKLREYGFDFFDREEVEYVGIIENPLEMGNLMRRCEYIYYPSFIDASPNTLLEALTCGCKPLLLNSIGGQKEQLDIVGRTIQEMAIDYQLVFNKLL